MGYAWAPQVTGLVRGEPKPGQRHRSNGLAICMEAMEERASKSPTLDRTKSKQNGYWHRDGGPSGTVTWETMCEAAEAYKIPVKLKNGKTAERGLGHNAVIGWAAILKPPPEMIAELGMKRKDIKQFCADGFRALEKIEPRLFRAENVNAIAAHADEETPHYHYIGTSKDKNGKYCGNLVDANLCVRINQEFPSLMRGMGWPIDDLDLTDWERMKTDEAYRAEREAKRKRQGQSVEQYGKQRAEAAGRVAARIITDAKSEAQAIKGKAVQDAKAEADKAGLETASKWERAAWMARQEKADLERDIGDMREYKAWKAQKAAQEAQEAARKREADEQARRAAEAARKAQEAQEQARREQEAKRAALAAQEAARPKTPEERYQEARAAIFGGGTAPHAAPEPPKRAAVSPLEKLKKMTQGAAARETGQNGLDGPEI